MKEEKETEIEEVHKKFVEEQENLYKEHDRKKRSNKDKKNNKNNFLIILVIILSLLSGTLGAYLILTYCYHNETTITNSIDFENDEMPF